MADVLGSVIDVRRLEGVMRVVASTVLAILLASACGGSTRNSGSTGNAEGGSAGAGDGVGGAAGTATSSSGGASQGGSSPIAGAGGDGVTGGTGGAATGGSSAGGAEGGCTEDAPCPATQYCDYADNLCGRGEPAGICRERPIGCAVPAEPLCGCGGVTPDNDRCMLSLHGMDIDAELVASGDTCVPGITPDPATLGAWYYGWMGGNLSFLEIALCADGRALYLHATAPEDPNPTVAEGTYTATSPTTFTLALQAVSSMDGTVLEYDSARDRLDRSAASDGYDSSGLHIEREALTWITPVLSCD